MKPATIFLSKIWAVALLSSIFFKYFSVEDLNHSIRLFFIWFIFLLYSLFAFIKYGTAILINSKIDKKLNYKKELFKLAIVISVFLWLANFFFFTWLGNLGKYHFYTIPFFLAMIFGIYFFNIRSEQKF